MDECKPLIADRSSAGRGDAELHPAAGALVAVEAGSYTRPLLSST